LYRQIRDLGYDWMVVAPSMIPKTRGERIKTNRRDAVTLASLLRTGELNPVWAPDPVHEAIRGMVRAREGANTDPRRKRQQLRRFCCATAGPTTAARIGAGLMGAGWPRSGSSTPLADCVPGGGRHRECR